MKLTKVIEELQHVLSEYGDIEVELQNSPEPEKPVIGYPSFVPEEYLVEAEGKEAEEVICNIRTWPY